MSWVLAPSPGLHRYCCLMLLWLVAAGQQTNRLPSVTASAESSSSSSDGRAATTDFSSSSSSSSSTSHLILPQAAIFQNPWVKRNIAVTYGHRLLDGIGSQTTRMLSVYALSNCLGIRHLFRPLRCVGHIGEHTHYRHVDCDAVDDLDAKILTRAQEMIQLPSSITEQEVESWDKKFISSINWPMFVRLVVAAAKQQRPTVFEIERPNELIRVYPDMFMTVPALRPSIPPVPFTCHVPGRQQQSGDPSSSNLSSSSSSSNHSSSSSSRKSWLLDALRVAIHVRRGDLVSDNWTSRMFNTSYYINLATTISNVLEPLGCHYVMEIYIEAPETKEAAAEVDLLQHHVPNAVMLIETDVLWTWQMMTTADILVMSKSLFSISAALMNPDAVSIYIPHSDHNRLGHLFRMKHWISTLDETGKLSEEAIESIRSRAGDQQQQQQK